MVNRIGHVGITVTDLERSVAHAESIMGLRVSERVGDVAYLTCNDRHHELVLSAGEALGCDHLGFEAADEDAMEAVRERVVRHRLTVLEADQPEPGVSGAFSYLAPGGFVIEVFHGMLRDQPASYDTVGARPRKFEHITLKSAHKEEFEAMLDEVLGLRLSDRAEDQISWWRASSEHHGVSVIRDEVDALQHYAWQVADFNSIGLTGDHLAAHDKAFMWGPGHHGIGDNYFCYFFDDDGAVVEYSANILHVQNEADYEPRVWPDVPRSVNRWGNPPPPVEFIEAGIPLLIPASLSAGGRS